LLWFSPLGSDTGVFLNKSLTCFTAIDTHVDNVTRICLSEEEEVRLKVRIQKFYKIKDKDTSKPFKVLGILVTRDMHQGILKMSQSDYIEHMLIRFNMSECNPIATPIDKASHMQDGESQLYESQKTYQALTGSLTYAAMLTQPDIGYVTQYLSQANKNPTQCDWNAVKWVLRYLKGTKDMGIMFRRDWDATHIQHGPLTPWGFCDANYVEDPHDCKSTSGFVFMLASSPILWKSKKQLSVSLSTMEAEYYALGIVCQEAAWLKQIGQELLMSLNKPIHIYSDNTGAIALSNNPVFHNRSKHIDICWHFVRELIRSKIVRTSHIPGTQNRADFLTKALSRSEHDRCIKLLGME